MDSARQAVHTGPAFGSLLRRHRLAAGLTQEELAERARISKRSIGDMERGVPHTPRKDTVALLAEALALAPADRRAFAAAAQRLALAALPQAIRDPVSAPPFVGRAHELALLGRHLAGEGPPLLLLAGEPGIGKTRLLQAARSWADGQRLRLLDGGCQRRGGHEPYAPIQGALQRHIRGQPRSRLRTELRGCAWLVRLLPELATGPIEPLPAWEVSPEHERRLMFEAVTRLLANVGGAAGVLLLLDDLQWAGPDALDLLSTLVHSAAEVPLRIVGTYRNTEVQPPDPLTVLLADLAHAGLSMRRVLAPLASPEAAQLLDHLLATGETVDPELRERVIRRAGGVPFFMVSCVAALRQHDGEQDKDGVPWDVTHTVQQRVAALSPAARAVLGVAAVAGRVVPRAVLVAVAPNPEGEVLAALGAACAARLLVEDGEQAYQFAHDIIREVVEADLGAARRAVLHRQVAEALESTVGELPVAALAYHYARSDAQDRAALYLEQAGDQARERFANSAAEEYYRELVERLDGLRRDLDAARAREKLGTVLWVLSHYAAALPMLKQAAETYQLLGDVESTARASAQVAEVYTISGASHEGLRYLRPVLEVLRARCPSRSLAGLYGALARLLFPIGQYREQLAAAERAAHLARSVQDEWLLAEATWMQGLGLLALGQDEDGRRALEEAVRLTAAVGQLDTLGRLLGRLTLLALDAGDLVVARSHIERAMQTAEQMGNPRLLADAWSKRGEISFVAGQWAEARVDHERAVALIRQIDLSHGTAWVLLGLARLAHGVGVQEEARHYLEQTMVTAERVSSLLALAAAHTLLAECEVLERQAGAASARLAVLLDRPELWPRDVMAAQATLAWAHLELGEVAVAEALVREASTRARAAHYNLILVDALRVQAMVLIRQGRWVEATGNLEEGLTVARSVPYPYAEGRLLHVNGRMLAAQGQTGPARERLEAALALFRQLGAHTDVEQVEQAFHTLSAS